MSTPLTWASPVLKDIIAELMLLVIPSFKPLDILKLFGIKTGFVNWDIAEYSLSSYLYL